MATVGEGDDPARLMDRAQLSWSPAMPALRIRPSDRHRRHPAVHAGAATALLLILGALLAATAAADPITAWAQETTTTTAHGSIGPRRAGMTITHRGDHLIAAHYYFARHPVDIPLTGAVHSGHVILKDAAGGVFRLRFITNSETKHRPLTFYYSTGLVGTWTGKGRVLSVRFGFETDYYGTPSFSSWYRNVTKESSAAFERRVQQFLDGVINDRPDEAAASGTWPITATIEGPNKTLVIRSKAALIADWKEIDTPAFIAIAEKAVPHEMFIHDGAALVDEIGYIWFGPGRAAEIDIPAP